MDIIHTRRYQKDLKRLGLTNLEIRALEQEIASNPQIGDVVPGLGGIRKMRFGFGGRDKRGGGRAIYFRTTPHSCCSPMRRTNRKT